MQGLVVSSNPAANGGRDMIFLAILEERGNKHAENKNPWKRKIGTEIRSITYSCRILRHRPARNIKDQIGILSECLDGRMYGSLEVPRRQLGQGLCLLGDKRRHGLGYL